MVPAFICSLCGSHFTSEETLNSHIVAAGCSVEEIPSGAPKEVTPQAKKAECVQCHKFFTTGSSLKRHLDDVHGDSRKAFGCPDCDKTFTRADGVKRHQNKVHAVSSTPPQSSTSNAESPKRLCSPPTSEPKSKRSRSENDCSLCGSHFTSEERLNSHIVAAGCSLEDTPSGAPKEVTIQAKNPECVQCHKFFTTDSSLKRHLEEVHGDSRKAFDCPDCNKTFTRAHHVKRHQNKVHAVSSTPPQSSTSNAESPKRLCSPPTSEPKSKRSRSENDCSLCGSHFTSEETLNSHIAAAGCSVEDIPSGAPKEVTPQAKNPECVQCHKFFTRDCNLQRHIEDVHGDGRKAFGCPDCHKTFTRADHLKRHQNKVHAVSSTPPQTSTSNAESPKRLCSPPTSEPKSKRSRSENARTPNLSSDETSPPSKRRKIQTDTTLAKNQTVPAPSQKLETKENPPDETNKTKNQHPCGRCEMSFRNKRGLYYHISLKHPEIVFDERRSVTTLNPKERNMARVMMVGGSYLLYKRDKSAKKRYQCFKCDYRSLSLKNIEHHLMNHFGIRPYVCRVCQKGFLTLWRLLAHGELHMEVKSHVCKVCGAMFGGIRLLKLHMYGHGVFQCDLCDNVYNSRRGFLGHMKTHNTAVNFLCEYCGETFTNGASFRKHLSHHHSIVAGDQIPCTECAKIFLSEKLFKTHFRQVHVKKRTVQCETCKRMFFGPGDLQTHMLHFHQETMPFVCEKCGKGFRQSHQLKGHAFTHTGEKPYKCKECYAGFTRSDYLRKHELTHSGEKPYLCNVCGKGFSRRSNLNVHVKYHKRVDSKQILKTE